MPYVSQLSEVTVTVISSKRRGGVSRTDRYSQEVERPPRAPRVARLSSGRLSSDAHGAHMDHGDGSWQRDDDVTSPAFAKNLFGTLVGGTRSSNQIPTAEQHDLAQSYPAYNHSLGNLSIPSSV